MKTGDLMSPTVVLRTRSVNTAVLLAGLLRSSGLTPGRDYLGGTMLPDGRFLDRDLAEPGPIEWVRERFGRRRVYLIGLDPAFGSDWVDSEEAHITLQAILAAVGSLLPDGASLDVESVSMDRSGLPWPPTEGG